ncbi:hypothetical protein FOC1_g10009880 [Fusarium oxysporum f. sp. cubense race 1]|uniref:Uncharacterized protein n=1 Tax=Fusarium oxysporum f. sp. cubense (strain race 1) TaxID=1229664 RepID=N4UWA8_FUSC1|nr:hypothetical protein FOC1_g10009880 [Fusarium oxysporum f. sp. cubense race 1]
MEPRPHDPNLSESLQPLIERAESVLAQKMERAVNAVSKLKAQGKRVLIFVKEDSTATTLNEMMRAHGLNSHEVATIWKRAECGFIVCNFNDADHPTDAIITTFATLKIPGPRFYGTCHRGIVLEMADDLEDVFRATRALSSIGQTQRVEWTNYYVQETLDMVHDLAVSRLFYSAVAKLLKENPGAASKFKKSTMARIAKSWKPGQTLTMDHVNLKLPTIEDGVVLYNYVKDGYKQQL